MNEPIQTMETDKIIFFRNFLFRTLILGVLFGVIFGAATMVFWDTAVSLGEHFFKIDEPKLGELTLIFFLNVRIVLVFFLLGPALALHWMLKSKK